MRSSQSNEIFDSFSPKHHSSRTNECNDRCIFCLYSLKDKQVHAVRNPVFLFIIETGQKANIKSIGLLNWIVHMFKCFRLY